MQELTGGGPFDGKILGEDWCGGGGWWAEDDRAEIDGFGVHVYHEIEEDGDLEYVGYWRSRYAYHVHLVEKARPTPPP